MKQLIIFLSFCFFFCLANILFSQNRISLPTEFRQQPFDVLHYDATIDLRNGMKKKISGICNIYFRWTQHPKNNFFFFHLRDLNVDSVFYQHQKIDFYFKGEDSIDYSYYFLKNLDGKENDTVVVTIYYSGEVTNEKGSNPFGGVFLKDSVLFANGVGFHNEYVSATQHWLPCYDHPSDKATFRFTFLYPKGFTLATNGKTEIIKNLDDTTEILIASSRYPIATYLMTFALGRFKMMELDPWNLPSNLEKLVFYLPKDEKAVQFAFNNFAKYFYSLQNRFGRYPFEKIGYVVVPFDNGAMEHQTMITFPNNYVYYLYQRKDTNNLMGLHELSHQWFGNSVSPLDFRDAWFNEAFATYSESAFLELNFGFDAYLKDLLQKKNYYINYIASKEGLLPLFGYDRKPPSSNYPATIYYKGAVVVGMLRYLLGDTTFFDLLRSYLDNFAYTSASTNDFLNYTIGHTLQNLNWFFEQWIFQQGYPILEIKTTQYLASPTKSNVLVSIQQIQLTNYGSYTNIPVELNFTLKNGKSLDTVVILASKEQIFWFDSLPPFVSFNTNLGRKVVSLFASSVYTTIDSENSGKPIEYFIEGDKIFFRMLECQSFQFNIYDVFGREVKSGNGGCDGLLCYVDISNLANGLYVLVLKQYGNLRSFKIIKN